MFTCSEKTACVSSRGPAMMRILLNAYQHDHVYDCPEIIKQYTDEYTDNNSGFAQFLSEEPRQTTVISSP